MLFRAGDTPPFFVYVFVVILNAVKNLADEYYAGDDYRFS
jgi:hypothetical protein